MKAILVWGCVMAGIVLNSSAADDYTEATELEQTANAWKESEPVPVRLLDYRKSWDGSCFPNPRGTEVLFGGITNYPLLRDIAFLPQVDLRVFSNAVINAITVAGPSRFFRDIAEVANKTPEREQGERI